MKKIFLSTAAAVLACGSAFAATTFPVDQVRIYLNPGHGSWGPNDRPMGIIGHPAYSTENTDTTSFFESNTNLHKAFALLDHLVEGYFHTYQPARHRAQNDDVCRHEGHLYARGLIDLSLIHI